MECHSIWQAPMMVRIQGYMRRSCNTARDGECFHLSMQTWFSLYLQTSTLIVFTFRHQRSQGIAASPSWRSIFYSRHVGLLLRPSMYQFNPWMRSILQPNLLSGAGSAVFGPSVVQRTPLIQGLNVVLLCFVLDSYILK